MSNDKKTYEAMFLLEAGSSDFETASEPIRSILNRYDANVLSMQPWEDRRLAYEIRKHKRGLYVLTYFDADPSRLAEIHHDCELNERILRVLILQRDHVPQEEISAETPAMAASRRAAKSQAPEQTEQAEDFNETELEEEPEEEPEEAYPDAVSEPSDEMQERGTREMNGSGSTKTQGSDTDASPEPESN